MNTIESEVQYNALVKRIKSILGTNEIAFLPTSSPIISEIQASRSTLFTKNRYFTCSLLASGGYGKYFGYVIVDLKKVGEKSVLDMYVPEDLVGLAIGVGGRNIENLIKEINGLNHLNITNINVHKIDS